MLNQPPTGNQPFPVYQGLLISTQYNRSPNNVLYWFTYLSNRRRLPRTMHEEANHIRLISHSVYNQYFEHQGLCCSVVASLQTWHQHTGEALSMAHPKDILIGTEVEAPHRSMHFVCHVGLFHWCIPYVSVDLRGH